jgi:hypothetical protein
MGGGTVGREGGREKKEKISSSKVFNKSFKNEL